MESTKRLKLTLLITTSSSPRRLTLNTHTCMCINERRGKKREGKRKKRQRQRVVNSYRMVNSYRKTSIKYYYHGVCLSEHWSCLHGSPVNNLQKSGEKNNKKGKSIVVKLDIVNRNYEVAPDCIKLPAGYESHMQAYIHILTHIHTDLYTYMHKYTYMCMHFLPFMFTC